jgi:hypothetical protein
MIRRERLRHWFLHRDKGEFSQRFTEKKKKGEGEEK